MTREEIRNTIFNHLKGQVAWMDTNPNQLPQFQTGSIHALFPNNGAPAWQHMKIEAIASEIIQEMENNGYIHEGQIGGMGSSATYPWYTITNFGKEAILCEDWLPYDPEGYIKALMVKVPTLDPITTTYIQESVSSYNRRQLLSASITLGVASENLMLLLIEQYSEWITDVPRKNRFKKRVEKMFISSQYKEFKGEFLKDLSSIPDELKKDWETYLDGIFNFIRLNRNDAGHPTGKQFDAKIVYANLQVFSEYAGYITKLMAFFS